MKHTHRKSSLFRRTDVKRAVAIARDVNFAFNRIDFKRDGLSLIKTKGNDDEASATFDVKTELADLDR